MKLKSTIIYQFVVLFAIIAMLAMQYVLTGVMNDIMLGALIGTFTGIPQAFESKEA